MLKKSLILFSFFSIIFSTICYSQNNQISSEHIVDETIDLSNGLDAPAILTIKTTFKGQMADALRPQFAIGIKNIQDLYYKKAKIRYPSLEQSTAFQVIDNSNSHSLQIVESYIIKHPIHLSSYRKSKSINYDAKELDVYLNTKLAKNRNTSLEIILPIKFEKKIHIKFPNHFPKLKTFNKYIEDKSFIFKANNRYKNNVYTINYSYESIDYYSSAKDTLVHMQNINKIKNMLSNSLEIIDTKNTIKSFHWINLILTLIIIIFSSYLSYRIYKYKPKSLSNIQEQLDDINGIRGWLLVIGLSLGSLLVFFVYKITKFASTLYLSSDWAFATYTAADAFNPFFSYFILLFTLGLIAGLIIDFLLIVLFILKKRNFPMVYLPVLWINLSFFTMGEGLKYRLLGENVNFIQWLGMLTIVLFSTFYILNSGRVRATFVNE